MENKNKNEEYLNSLFDTGAEVGEAAAVFAHHFDMTASVLALVDTLVEMKNHESPQEAAVMISGTITRFVSTLAKEAANEIE